MPLYDYRCRECETVFEELVTPLRSSEPCCPRCRSKAVTRLLSKPAPAGASVKSGGGGCAPRGGFT